MGKKRPNGGSKKRASQARRLFRFQAGICAFCTNDMEHPDIVRADGEMLLPHAPTLDHFVPASQGGPDFIWNKLLMHRVCNDIRADGPVPEHTLEMHNKVFEHFYINRGHV